MNFKRRFLPAALGLLMTLVIACGSSSELGVGVIQDAAPSPVVDIKILATPIASDLQPASAIIGTAGTAPVAVGSGQTPGSTSPAGIGPAGITTSKDNGGSPLVLAALRPVGTGVGDLTPPYVLLLADGSTATSEELNRAGKPVFLMFTATW